MDTADSCDFSDSEIFKLAPGVQNGDSILYGSRLRKAGSSENLFSRNVRWYINCRWLVILIFVVFGTLSYLPGFFSSIAIRQNLQWPFYISGLLLILNCGYLIHYGIQRNRADTATFKGNLWVQIILDLLIVTMTVFLVSAAETTVPYIYLFHIVLACIFLPRSQSFAVTILSVVLFSSIVIVEFTGALPSRSIFTIYTSGSHQILLLINGIITVTIWMIVWLLASHLSSLVLQRERELETINSRLIEIQKEKMKHMLHTTHELKAPFAAIQANTQLLLKGYCGSLSAEAQEVVERIGTRSIKLTATIHEMLQLANLQSGSDKPVPRTNIDISEILHWCIEQLRQVAQERGVMLAEDMESGFVKGVPDHLKMLFLNIISNAIIYSHRQGTVYVSARRQGTDGIVVVVEDHGIGIDSNKLPHIFDEYYHTNEAVKHNPGSTGLGLAIVGRVAQINRIEITVSSRKDCGTRLNIFVPA